MKISVMPHEDAVWEKELKIESYNRRCEKKDWVITIDNGRRLRLVYTTHLDYKISHCASLTALHPTFRRAWGANLACSSFRISSPLQQVETSVRSVDSCLSTRWPPSTSELFLESWMWNGDLSLANISYVQKRDQQLMWVPQRVWDGAKDCHWR